MLAWEASRRRTIEALQLYMQTNGWPWVVIHNMQMLLLSHVSKKEALIRLACTGARIQQESDLHEQGSGCII